MVILVVRVEIEIVDLDDLEVLETIFDLYFDGKLIMNIDDLEVKD